MISNRPSPLYLHRWQAFSGTVESLMEEARKHLQHPTDAGNTHGQPLENAWNLF